MAKEKSISSVSSINPNSFESQQFSPKDNTIIPSFNIESEFNPTNSKVELFIYDLNNNSFVKMRNSFNWYAPSSLAPVEDAIADGDFETLSDLMKTYSERVIQNSFLLNNQLTAQEKYDAVTTQSEINLKKRLSTLEKSWDWE